MNLIGVSKEAESFHKWYLNFQGFSDSMSFYCMSGIMLSVGAPGWPQIQIQPFKYFQSIVLTSFCVGERYLRVMGK